MNVIRTCLINYINNVECDTNVLRFIFQALFLQWDGIQRDGGASCSLIGEAFKVRYLLFLLFFYKLKKLMYQVYSLQYMLRNSIYSAGKESFEQIIV